MTGMPGQCDCDVSCLIHQTVYVNTYFGTPDRTRLSHPKLTCHYLIPSGHEIIVKFVKFGDMDPTVSCSQELQTKLLYLLNLSTCSNPAIFHYLNITGNLHHMCKPPCHMTNQHPLHVAPSLARHGNSTSLTEQGVQLTRPTPGTGCCM